MRNSAQQFSNAIKAAGLIPPDTIEPGKLHRMPGMGKAGSNSAAWCKLFDDGIGGVFGDFSSGFESSWQAEREAKYSETEIAAFKARIAEERKQREAEEAQRKAEAQTKAAAIWQKAEPAPGDHPYLTRKGIKASGAKLHSDGRLVIPCRADGETHSLQFIGPDGSKQFLPGGRIKGCYFSMGNPNGAAALCIAEGFATGATIHEATSYPVAVAFNAGNVGAVAKAMRDKFPDLPLILCADDDTQTEGNPGLTSATEAARSVGGLLALPDFGIDRPVGATDFNDMAALCGQEATANAIVNAKPVADAIHQAGAENVTDGDSSGWPDPQPMTAKTVPEAYPVEALPDTVRAAVEEVAGFVKAPVPMVASSALAALSLAIQAHADAKRAEKLSGPIGLFLLTIADSGERKSTCDGYFFPGRFVTMRKPRPKPQNLCLKTTGQHWKHGKQSAAASKN
jgi:putative DNA primase/helicase